MSTALREATQEELDAALEREIETARRASLYARDPELQRAAAVVLARLEAQRSPSTVAR